MTAISGARKLPPQIDPKPAIKKPKGGDDHKQRGADLGTVLERHDGKLKVHGAGAIKLLKQHGAELYHDPKPTVPGTLAPAVFDPSEPRDDIDPDLLAAIHDSPRAQHARMLQLVHAIREAATGALTTGGSILGAVTQSIVDAAAGAAANGAVLAAAAEPTSAPDDDPRHGGRRPPG